MEQLPQETDKMTFKQKVYYSTGCFFELTKWVVVAVVIGVIIHFFIGTLFIVDGESMEPNYHSGQFVIVNRWLYNFGSPERGDVVVLRFPGDPENKKYIKRVIGLPGERVEIRDGKVYINSKKLPESYIPPSVPTQPNLTRDLRSDDYFLLGDNRLNSSDSRIWGICPKRDLIGRAWLIVWPWDQRHLAEQATY